MKSKATIFTLMLALVMTLSLAACGGSKQEEAPADNAGNGEAAGDTQDFGGAELVVATWGWAEAGLKTLAADLSPSTTAPSWWTPPAATATVSTS